jgi:hypothetical protein
LGETGGSQCARDDKCSSHAMLIVALLTIRE